MQTCFRNARGTRALRGRTAPNRQRSGARDLESARGEVVLQRRMPPLIRGPTDRPVRAAASAPRFQRAHGTRQVGVKRRDSFRRVGAADQLSSTRPRSPTSPKEVRVAGTLSEYERIHRDTSSPLGWRRMQTCFRNARGTRALRGRTAPNRQRSGARDLESARRKSCLLEANNHLSGAAPSAACVAAPAELAQPYRRGPPDFVNRRPSQCKRGLEEPSSSMMART